MTKSQKKTKLSYHDRYFRKTMSLPEVAREFLEANLPESVRDQVNYDTLKVENGTFVEESLKMQVADVLMSAEIRVGKGSQNGYIYVLCEHASTPDKWLPFRMLKYMLGVLDQVKAQDPSQPFPLIVPLIFYTGAKKYTHSLDFFDLFGDNKAQAKTFFTNPCPMTDLSKIPEESLTQTFYGPMARLMKHIRDKEFLSHLQQCLELMDRMMGAHRLDFIYASISYIIEGRSEEEFATLDETIRNTLSDNTKEVAMRTIADMFREQGIQAGMEKGIQAGMEKERQETLKRLQDIASVLLSEGKTVENVSKMVGLPIEDVKKLQHSFH